MGGSGLPILTYHALETSPSPIATDPGWFAETMAVLAQAGYRAIDLADWLARGRPALARAFAITFDDGLRSVWKAAEILAVHDFPATLFVVSGWVGRASAWPSQPARIPRRRLLDWHELADLRAGGFGIGSHTRTHRDLHLCSNSELAYELRCAQEEIEARLGQRCGLLAYPYGSMSRRVRSCAARYYEAAFSTRLDYAKTAEDRYGISRIDAHYLRSQRALERLIAGEWRDGLGVKRALRGVRQTARALCWA